MQAILIIRKMWHHPKQVVSAENPFAAPDRATLNIMRARAEQIDAARRYWACPF
jgi:hypothetical protein